MVVYSNPRLSFGQVTAFRKRRKEMKKMRQRLKWLAVVFLFLWAPLMWGCIKPTLEVETNAGTLAGKVNKHASAFLGVPFAKPPVGDLRWKAPQDPEPWTGTRDATQSQSVCVQAEMSTTWHSTGQIIGNEDCLYLDVYRPKNYHRNLPVYVYFHGGANRFGGAASYDGSTLAKDQDIIVVIAQYRLGPLGWLSHPALRTGDAFDNSGNFGTLDNIKALQWVRDNIAGFGGDPANVTIGGQSAGASNVAKLLISPLAAGLFHKAVLQSLGGAIMAKEAGDALADGMLANLAGYNQIDPADSAAVEAFLRGKSAAELVAAHGTTYAGFADGTVLPGGYVETIYSGDYNAVPVMLGSTEYEFKNFLPLYGPAFGKPNWGKVYDLFDRDFDPTYKWTFAEIFPTQAEIDLYEAMGKYRSLGWKYKCVDELATLLQNRQDDVYAFMFKWGGPDSASEEFAHVFGPAHAMDIPFFFGEDEDLFGYALTKKNRPGFQSLQRVMMTYLGNFIRNGDPGRVNGVEWKQWANGAAADAPKCMLLDADMKRARIGMDTRKLTLEALQAEAADEVQGWGPAAAALVTSSVAAYTPEYLLNDEGHELLYSTLKFNSMPNAAAYSGVHAQAGYRIEVPEGWTAGEDDLVLYAHGYAGTGTTLSVSTPTRLRNHLIANGFAWAASSYTANGYNIASGVQSTADLLAYFKTRFGEPRRVYLTGHSMGGHITARSITDPAYADGYDAALPMCGVVGGGVELFSYFLDWGLASSYYAGLNYEVPFDPATEYPAWQQALYGPAGDGHGALGYIPRYPSGGTAALNANGELFKAATMYRSGGLRPLYDRAFSYYADFVLGRSVQWLLDPTQASGSGNLVGNATTQYRLDPDDATTSADEAALNAGIQRVSNPTGDLSASMWDVTGNVNIPVLSLHTLGDLYVPFSMEQIWARRIAEAGKEDRFQARAIRALTHCEFSVDEEVQAFADLVDWVETSTVPQGDDILTPSTVARPDFGCAFTTPGRAYDLDYTAQCTD
ncbi:MAG: hypothetical protein C4519_23270 [Desulfobacteraceae bacterium]|nr:MAG: hypothetical protein C4519_23270 [Desulfobacteraceae bacterium]